MADRAQLMKALRAAHDAKDADGARRIAEMIRAADNTATAGETAVDMARVIPGGLTKGVGYVLDQASPTYPINQMIGAAENVTGQTLPRLPTPSQHVETLVNQATGGYYKSQTAGGRYVERLAEMAPAAATPGGAVARIARMALPGLGSAAGEDIAGEIDPKLAPYGSAFGALAGGVATLPRVTRSISQVALGVPRAERILTNTAARSAGGAAGVRQRAAEFEATGEPYSFIDVGGHGTQRVLRAAAAGEGPAQDRAIDYANRLAAQTPERAEAATYRLTPNDRRTPAQAVTEREAANEAEMATRYPGPYREPVPWTPELERGLGDRPGVSAIRGAMEGAIARAGAADINVARQARAQVAEYEAYLAYLRNPRDAAGRMRPVPRFSGAALDRIRIAMREAANAASREGHGSIASGLHGRRVGIDTALDRVPHLRDARAAARRGYTDVEAVELGSEALRTPDRDYAAQIAELATISPNARAHAGLGMRDAMVNSIRARPEGMTGSLNTLANAPRVRANTAETFGPQAAQMYQTQINQITRRLQTARQNTPTAGSRTAILESDMKSLPSIPHSSLGALVALGNWMRTKGVVTDAVRAEMQRLGTSETEVRRLVARIPTNVSTAEHIARIYASSQGDRRTP